MTEMGERHHRFVCYDGISKQNGGGQASISQTFGLRRPYEVVWDTAHRSGCVSLDIDDVVAS